MLSQVQAHYLSKDLDYYRRFYPVVIILTMIIILLIIMMSFVLIYQLQHRPIPKFYAMQSSGKEKLLKSYEAPNFLPETITRFASKGTTAAYTFSFNRIEADLALAQPYFTASGWTAYRDSVQGLTNTVLANQLTVNAIVYGTPIITNQGELPDLGYTWRVQIPLLVVYQSASAVTTQKYYVIVTIVKVPTYINPRGIGIDQFVMTNG